MAIEEKLQEVEVLSMIDESIARFGVEAQIDKAIEEISELLVELTKYKKMLKRKNVTPEYMSILRDNILTERVDVNIMLKDLDLIFNFTNNEKKLRFEQQFNKLSKYVENARN